MLWYMNNDRFSPADYPEQPTRASQQPVTQQQAPLQQPMMPSPQRVVPQYAIMGEPGPIVDNNPAGRGKVNLLAYLLFVIAILGGVMLLWTYISLPVILPTTIVGLVEVSITLALAIGILMRNKLSYHVFNVLAALSILDGLVMLLSSFMLLLVMPLVGIFVTVVRLATVIIWIYGIVVLHPKSVRQQFHIG